MASQIPATQLQIRSTVRKDGSVELGLHEAPVPQPKENEVLVRVEAAPLNPSDLGGMFGGADVSKAVAKGTSDKPIVSAMVPAGAMGGMGPRIDRPMPVGNEGGGVVVAAGSSPSAQALLGKTVGIFGGATYGQYRCVPANAVIPVRSGVTPAQAAAMFVNPLTALGMVEQMKLEGHKALVHTAAASNLGQMLVKICLTDNIPLINIVRKPEQVALLKSIGAAHVLDSSSPTFNKDLTDALATTGATIAFDAIGGGRIGSTILSCMEAAALATAKEYSRYGSTTKKVLYIYGGLDRSPTTLNRNFGMQYTIGGWLLMPFLEVIGEKEANRLRQRVADEITTTFASHYTEVLSLKGALELAKVKEYSKMATGQKVLIMPHKL